MTNYSMPVVLGTLSAGNQALSQFDTNFDAVARMGTYQCSATGTNTIALTPLSGYPTMTAYGNLQKIGFVAVNTTTNTTTIQVLSLGGLNAYQQDGTTQIGSGDIVSGGYYEFSYNSALNSNAGGWQQIASTNSSSSIKSIAVQSFTISGTYTPTAGMSYCIIEAIGGGGGGGSVAANQDVAGAGGGSGGYAKVLFTSSDIGSSQVITIGTAGAGGASGGNNAGGNGSVTSVGSLLVCNGGLGGAAGSTGGSGGSGGSVTISGGATLVSFTGGTGGVATASSIAASGGLGVPTPLGAAGGSGLELSSGNSINGLPATGYGSSGGGAANLSQPASQSGGDGAPGIVIITEYCS